VVLELEGEGFDVVVVWECEALQPRILRQRLLKVERAPAAEKARRRLRSHFG
jgi:G:T-mismatch repair DNA endonuclease (very short patch repair protein)